LTPGKAKATLPDPFPIEKLRELDFGSNDGHRDDLAQDMFIVTSAVKKFFLNKHSVIVGAIGTGKSTLFRLLKNRHKEIDAFKNDLIIPLEEALSFSELSDFTKEYYIGKDERTLYQLLWKFNILSKTAIAISGMPNFPESKSEQTINNFLKESLSTDAYSSIISKVKDLISNANIKFEANIADHPITLEAGIKKPSNNKKKINLEEVQRAISSAVKERGYDKATIIIDKIDRFVAGIEYAIQRNFLTALLEVDDDMASDSHLNLKIFIRYDLFERLNFSNLGYDKVVDNAVILRWSKDETLRFLATRICMALHNAQIANFHNMILATDLSEYGLSFRERFLLNPSIPKILKKVVSKKQKVERDQNLFGKFDKSFITKVFPRKAIHYCASSQQTEEIGIFEFLGGHFIDGNSVCTPRYMLIFLKEVVNNVASYYEENPDQISELVLVDKDYEWDLFKKKCVYTAYIDAKDIYVKNIGTVDEKWAKQFSNFTSKKGNKTKFDFKWIRANLSDVSEQDSVDFLSFLQVIGYLKISEHHSDIKKRGYELPILYKTAPNHN